MNMGALNRKWVKTLAMGHFGIHASCTVLYSDNQSAITICKDSQSSDRTRHICGKYLKVQDLIKKEVLTLQWVPTTSMLAYALTMQLPKPAFKRFRSDIGIIKMNTEG